MRRVLDLVDAFRIDHFRGFAAYWTVPAGRRRPRATGGGRPGPGRRSSAPPSAELGPLPVIAEDLGLITPDVHALRDELGFPGMAVLLWAFDGRAGQPPWLENHRENQVVYTSTHDTDTLAGHTGRMTSGRSSSARSRRAARWRSSPHRTSSGSAARRA